MVRGQAASPHRGEIAGRHGLDTADQIVMGGRPPKGACLLPAYREEYTLRSASGEKSGGRGHVGHAQPSIARHGLPRWAVENDERHASLVRSDFGIGGDHPRKGMRRVDDKIDTLGSHVPREALRAAKATDAHRAERDAERIARSAREGQDHREAGTRRKAFRDPSRLTGAAENETVHGFL